MDCDCDTVLFDVSPCGRELEFDVEEAFATLQAMTQILSEIGGAW